MSSLAIPGRFSKYNVSEDGVVMHNVGGIIDMTLSFNIDELETTSHDDNGIRSYIPNHSDVTAELSCRWLDGNPGQRLIVIASKTKQRLAFEAYADYDPGSGKFYWTGLCFPTGLPISGPLDDTAGLDLTLRLSNVQQLTQ